MPFIGAKIATQRNEVIAHTVGHVPINHKVRLCYSAVASGSTCDHCIVFVSQLVFFGS